MMMMIIIIIIIITIISIHLFVMCVYSSMEFCYWTQHKQWSALYLSAGCHQGGSEPADGTHVCDRTWQQGG